MVLKLTNSIKKIVFAASCSIASLHLVFAQRIELPLFYWQENFTNFGDYISLKLVERMVGKSICVAKKNYDKRKLLAIGSIVTFAKTNDVIWGSGINGKWMNLKHYKFTDLDVRAVRGPLTREFLIKNFGIDCPEIYGDPALLLPYFFPEFKRIRNPLFDYIIIPHYSEELLFPKEEFPNVVYPTEPWNTVIEKMLNSKFVISSSLHGIIVAEAFGIPARLLRLAKKEPIFKYKDYYLGTGRPNFKAAYSIDEALQLGGEEPVRCDLKKLYEAFPFEYWPDIVIKSLNF